MDVRMDDKTAVPLKGLTIKPFAPCSPACLIISVLNPEDMAKMSAFGNLLRKSFSADVASAFSVFEAMKTSCGASSARRNRLVEATSLSLQDGCS